MPATPQTAATSSASPSQPAAEQPPVLSLLQHAKNKTWEPIIAALDDNERWQAALADRDEKRLGIVHFAAAYNNVAVLSKIKERDVAQLSSLDNDSNTPLHHAIQSGAFGTESVPGTVAMLIEYASDTIAKARAAGQDKSDQLTPIHLLVRQMTCGSAEAKRTFLALNATNATPLPGLPPYTATAMIGTKGSTLPAIEDTLRTIYKDVYKNDPSHIKAADTYGFSAPHFGVLQGDAVKAMTLLPFLCEMGVDINQKTTVDRRIGTINYPAGCTAINIANHIFKATPRILQTLDTILKIPGLVKHINEQRQVIQQQQEKINTQQGRIDSLTDLNTKLQLAQLDITSSKHQTPASSSTSSRRPAALTALNTSHTVSNITKER